MDDSMEEEGDSLFSLPGLSHRSRALYQTPPQPIHPSTSTGPIPPVGLGFHSAVVPQHLPEMDESFEQPNRWRATGDRGASPPDISTSTAYDYGQQDEQEQDDEEEEEEVGVEGSYEASESSSAQYDPDTDPEGFAQRLDELAGVLEIGEEESKAIRWGLPISQKQKQGPDLPLADFRKLINHHLNTTEWKYTSSIPVVLPIPGRSGDTLPIGGGLTVDSGDIHPIRVLGRGWTERDEWIEMDSGSEDMQIEYTGGL
ncbi:hypothetical protein I203_107581 [Kwoniella mangroviensis CBS 8507]|uniref:hypothetical protein n=1 Tax=Kwoniella mangroviensis CBS 8507 TaxID=1296122 RepID=UPI00080CF852|nr:uncharacterized protein I203_02329 [Kwoniella mangroviensis CBS 8507]OCF68935.1 hypothetical protein I203_02329 [Kwoniella mangroviensis CBS 8507]